MDTKDSDIIAASTRGREFLVQRVADGCYEVRCPDCGSCGTFDVAGAWPISLITFLDAHQRRCGRLTTGWTGRVRAAQFETSTATASA